MNKGVQGVLHGGPERPAAGDQPDRPMLHVGMQLYIYIYVCRERERKRCIYIYIYIYGERDRYIDR